MKWYWIALIGFGLPWAGYFLCALMAAGKRADELMEQHICLLRAEKAEKMWRTFKAESGYRMTKGYLPEWDITLLDLMNAHEKRAE